MHAITGSYSSVIILNYHFLLKKTFSLATEGFLCCSYQACCIVFVKTYYQFYENNHLQQYSHDLYTLIIIILMYYLFIEIDKILYRF